jgi:hypothetical protein
MELLGSAFRTHSQEPAAISYSGRKDHDNAEENETNGVGEAK